MSSELERRKPVIPDNPIEDSDLWGVPDVEPPEEIERIPVGEKGGILRGVGRFVANTAISAENKRRESLTPQGRAHRRSQRLTIDQAQRQMDALIKKREEKKHLDRSQGLENAIVAAGELRTKTTISVRSRREAKEVVRYSPRDLTQPQLDFLEEVMPLVIEVRKHPSVGDAIEGAAETGNTSTREETCLAMGTIADAARRQVIKELRSDLSDSLHKVDSGELRNSLVLPQAEIEDPMDDFPLFVGADRRFPGEVKLMARSMAVGKALGKGDNLTLTERGRRAIELASRFASNAGRMGRALELLGIDPDEIRQKVESILKSASKFPKDEIDEAERKLAALSENFVDAVEGQLDAEHLSGYSDLPDGVKRWLEGKENLRFLTPTLLVDAHDRSNKQVSQASVKAGSEAELYVGRLRKMLGAGKRGNRREVVEDLLTQTSKAEGSSAFAKQTLDAIEGTLGSRALADRLMLANSLILTPGPGGKVKPPGSRYYEIDVDKILNPPTRDALSLYSILTPGSYSKVAQIVSGLGAGGEISPVLRDASSGRRVKGVEVRGIVAKAFEAEFLPGMSSSEVEQDVFPGAGRSIVPALATLDRCFSKEDLLLWLRSGKNEHFLNAMEGIIDRQITSSEGRPEANERIIKMALMAESANAANPPELDGSKNPLGSLWIRKVAPYLLDPVISEVSARRDRLDDGNLEEENYQEEFSPRLAEVGKGLLVGLVNSLPHSATAELVEVLVDRIDDEPKMSDTRLDAIVEAASIVGGRTRKKILQASDSVKERYSRATMKLVDDLLLDVEAYPDRYFGTDSDEGKSEGSREQNNYQQRLSALKNLIGSLPPGDGFLRKNVAVNMFSGEGADAISQIDLEGTLQEPQHFSCGEARKIGVPSGSPYARERIALKAAAVILRTGLEICQETEREVSGATVDAYSQQDRTEYFKQQSESDRAGQREVARVSLDRIQDKTVEDRDKQAKLRTEKIEAKELLQRAKKEAVIIAKIGGGDLKVEIPESKSGTYELDYSMARVVYQVGRKDSRGWQNIESASKTLGTEPEYLLKLLMSGSLETCRLLRLSIEACNENKSKTP